jgi:hypothetical protein
MFLLPTAGHQSTTSSHGAELAQRSTAISWPSVALAQTLYWNARDRQGLDSQPGRTTHGQVAQKFAKHETTC